MENDNKFSRIKKMIGNAYPLPNFTKILDQLESAKYFNIRSCVRISPNTDV